LIKRLSGDGEPSIRVDFSISREIALVTLWVETKTAAFVSIDDIQIAVPQLETSTDVANDNIKRIAELRAELNYYKKNAGVVSSPYGFVDRVQREIEQLQHTEAQKQIEKQEQIQLRYRLLLDDEIAKICTVGPVRLDFLGPRVRDGSGNGGSPKRSDPLKDGELNEYSLYRQVVWKSERYMAPTPLHLPEQPPLEKLLPEEWRGLVDAQLVREKGMVSPESTDEISEAVIRDRVPGSVRRAVWTRDNGRCANCGSRERLEYDHIVPISKGGSNTERNIELLCEFCNRSKSDQIR
jgi:hypothetical protein